jgi:hypothetical protein
MRHTLIVLLHLKVIEQESSTKLLTLIFVCFIYDLRKY